MRKFNIFMDGVFLETLVANDYEEAYKLAESKYHALDDDLLEVEETSRLTYQELVDEIRKHNAENHITSQFEDKNPLHCVIVFKNESWPNRKEDYSLESRSYEFVSSNKRFIPGMGGNSIFANCLDGTDPCLRLDYYLGKWIIDYCYIKEE